MFFLVLTPIWVGVGVGGEGFPPPIGCPLITQEPYKLQACSIRKHFVRDVRAKRGIPNSPQSPDIWQNSNWAISDFRISGPFPIKSHT